MENNAKRIMPKDVGLNIEVRDYNGKLRFSVVDNSGLLIAGPYEKMPFIYNIEKKGEVRTYVVKADGTADLIY